MNCSGRNFESRDLSNIDFTGADFSDARLLSANLNGAKLDSARFERSNLSDADLSYTDLRRANFSGATLARTKLEGAVLDECNFRNAKFEGAPFSEGTDLSGCIFLGANLNDCKLPRIRFEGCDLSYSTFRSANCTDSSFDGADLTETDLSHATLHRCSFRLAGLKGANLRSARLDGADFGKAKFLENFVDGASFNEVSGLHRAERLETVRIGEVLPRYLDTVIVPRIDRWLSWERLRVTGKLPLFGASYSALLAMPFFFYVFELINGKIEQLRNIAATMPADGTLAPLARAILLHIHKEPVPDLSKLLFLSTIVLAIGATIYAIGCPGRVKEFSKEQWQDQLKQSLIHYLPFSWSTRPARIICALAYAVGGTGVLFVLLTKIYNALVFLWQNS
ncbi:hypothetical protein A1D31_39335 [Bradyrhizobium liaoningense]|nr:hypothetical protein A1D31_39335 [Bradyrhizobium liaoningense]